MRLYSIVYILVLFLGFIPHQSFAMEQVKETTPSSPTLIQKHSKLMKMNRERKDVDVNNLRITDSDCEKFNRFILKLFNGLAGMRFRGVTENTEVNKGLRAVAQEVLFHNDFMKLLKMEVGFRIGTQSFQTNFLNASTFMAHLYGGGVLHNYNYKEGHASPVLFAYENVQDNKFKVTSYGFLSEILKQADLLKEADPRSFEKLGSKEMFDERYKGVEQLLDEEISQFAPPPTAKTSLSSLVSQLQQKSEKEIGSGELQIKFSDLKFIQTTLENMGINKKNAEKNGLVQTSLAAFNHPDFLSLLRRNVILVKGKREIPVSFLSAVTMMHFLPKGAQQLFVYQSTTSEFTVTIQSIMQEIFKQADPLPETAKQEQHIAVRRILLKECGVEDESEESVLGLRDEKVQVELKKQSILTIDGKLTEATLKSSQVIRGNLSNFNREVIEELTKDGSLIGEWAKYKTKPFSLFGKKEHLWEIHFYKATNGGVNYRYDYKLKKSEK